MHSDEHSGWQLGPKRMTTRIFLGRRNKPSQRQLLLSTQQKIHGWFWVRCNPSSSVKVDVFASTSLRPSSQRFLLPDPGFSISLDPDRAQDRPGRVKDRSAPTTVMAPVVWPEHRGPQTTGAWFSSHPQIWMRSCAFQRVHDLGEVIGQRHLTHIWVSRTPKFEFRPMNDINEVWNAGASFEVLVFHDPATSSIQLYYHPGADHEPPRP